ncbi:hypothetical protein FSST1_008329 [Fusarium sambucinum]
MPVTTGGKTGLDAPLKVESPSSLVVDLNSKALSALKSSETKLSGTIENRPPSRDALKSDPLDVGVNIDSITIDDALDTLGRTPFCYIYE